MDDKMKKILRIVLDISGPILGLSALCINLISRKKAKEKQKNLIALFDDFSEEVSALFDELDILDDELSELYMNYDDENDFVLDEIVNVYDEVRKLRTQLDDKKRRIEILEDEFDKSAFGLKSAQKILAHLYINIEKSEELLDIIQQSSDY